jgi:peptidoglycan/LPS O-acetylase OafA/YrhL
MGGGWPDERRVRYLDGLRGVACLQVVLLHVLSAYFPGFVYYAPDSIGNVIRQSPLFVLYNGWLAVFVFLILSGYVLTGAYGEAGDTARRIEARAVRLWIPAASFGAIAVMMYFVFPSAHDQLADLNGNAFLKWCWSVHADVSGVLRDVFVFPILTGYHNGLLATIIPGAAPAFLDTAQSFNAPVWTLSVEMIGSILILWLASCRKNRTRWIGSMIIASVASPMLACFVAGHLAAVARLADRYVLSRRLAAVANLVLFTIGVDLSVEADNLIRLSLGALLIFVAVVQSRLARRILVSDVCMAIGRRSVTIYLLHWPFVFGFGAWLQVLLEPVVPWQTARLFVAPALILVVLVVSGPLSRIDAAAVFVARRIARGETGGFVRGAISYLTRLTAEFTQHLIVRDHESSANTRSEQDFPGAVRSEAASIVPAPASRPVGQIGWGNGPAAS